MKYTFSGHESFPCKALWVKKGYDFITKGLDFNTPNSVIDLGVGRTWSLLYVFGYVPLA